MGLMRIVVLTLFTLVACKTEEGTCYGVDLRTLKSDGLCFEKKTKSRCDELNYVEIDLRKVRISPTNELRWMAETPCSSIGFRYRCVTKHSTATMKYDHVIFSTSDDTKLTEKPPKVCTKL